MWTRTAAEAGKALFPKFRRWPAAAERRMIWAGFSSRAWFGAANADEARRAGMAAGGWWRIDAVSLLTVPEAARQLGLSADTVYGLCSARKLRHERVGLRGGRIRIPEEAIEEDRRRNTVGVEEAVKSPPPSPIRLRHVSL